MKLTCILTFIAILAGSNQKLLAGLSAGAAQVDITPRKLPVTVNGGFLTNKVRIIADRLHSRAIVFSDNDQTIAIAVVDSCMIPTHLCDAVKEKVSKETGINKDKILICATHTHSAPSVMDLCLGTDKDEDYTKFLPEKISESIIKAHSSLRPAKAGWAVFDGSNYTKPRRWALWPGTGTDPFGEKSIRANMHPGYQNPNATGETGPTDPWFTLFSLISEDDEPIAVLGNFSMHYFSGHSGISSDYFGRYSKEMSARLGNGSIVALSQGTSGDVWRADYGKRREESEISIKRYVKELTDLSAESLSTIKYSSDLPISMKEKRIVMGRRVPDKDRLEWAKKVSQGIKNNIPRSKAEVYARQALYLQENSNTEVVLQAIRVGNFGITTMPNEVYALTGLKLKSWSPLGTTMNIELANGAEGYIPPAEQHFLGGYTTWPSVTAGLEIGAEKKITSHLIEMLETISGKPKKAYNEALGKYAEAINVLNPLKKWRLGDVEPGKGFEDGVVFHLPGVEGKGFPDNHRSRSANFAGGRIASEAKIGDQYSISLWFRNGLRKDARLVTGYFFSRGDPDNSDAPGDHVGIGGTAGHAGKLIIFNGNESNDLLAGKQDLIKGRWYHLVFVRNKKQVRAYVNGKQEMAGELEPTHSGSNDFFIGGRSDQFANFEGRIDEVAFFDRVLSAVEVGALYETAGIIPVPDSPPLLPAQSLKKAHVPKGYKVELVASEPLVMDPVAIDWSSDGSVWVAEMADYPSGENGVLGRIAKLIDTNGDHRPDKRQVLIDDVAFPTGVMSWGDGVIVTCAGKIFYAEDEDGDGIADRKEDWFTGFIENNQQLRVNGLRWGLDDWIYCASGGHHAGFGVNTVITCAKNGKKIQLGARDFRFRPDGSFEPVAGPSQFGRVRDNEGNWFGVQNAHPIWHYVLEDRYLKRNPDIAAPDPRKMLRSKSPKIYSAGKAQKRFHGFDMIGRYTSACGISIYRDNILFDHASGQISAFTCEPFSNLVQRHVLKDHGVTFTARRAEEDGDHDFFASEDRWCRPVMSRTAPDGSLWVVDMYRYMIEHPQWLPPEGKQELKPHYYSGQGKGRIYRVIRQGAQHKWQVPNKDSPNGIVRDIALRESFRKGESILWNRKQITEGLISKERSVRKVALRKAEKLTEIIPEVLNLANDPDPKVRLQAAYTLGEFESDEAGQALSKIAQSDGEDPYFVAAVLSSANPHFRTLAGSGGLSFPITEGLLKMSHRFPGMGEKISEGILAKWSGPDKWRLLASASSDFRERVRAAAVIAANDNELSADERASAVRLLGKENIEGLIELLGSENSKEIQLASLKHLATLGSFVSILDSWSFLGPAGREAAETALLSKEQGAHDLLSRIESGKINSFELSPSSLERIHKHSSPKIRDRAKKVLAETVTGTRNEVIDQFRPSLSMQGNYSNGKKHFIARCSSCHRIGETGRDFGPDLKTLSNRSPESLLISILAPSDSIEPRYLAYSTDIKDENIYGLVEAETSNSIIMRLIDGTKRALNRKDILTLKGTGKSIMPEGLEAGLSLQDFADLLSYLLKELASN